MDSLREALQFCELGDLGFEGDIFTWRNHSKDLSSYICERLDRATANDRWREKFPDFTVVNGAPRHSDHRPVIVWTQGADRSWKGGDRGFRFEARWLQEEGCEDVIREAWEQSWGRRDGGVAHALREVAGKLRTWDREVVGAVEGRLKKAKAELERCMAARVSQEKIEEEARLRCVVDELEEKKNTMWKQRAHVWWLLDGDRNTRFYHTVASARKKRTVLRS
ncbi:uncharacterized protein [Aegilops tauschii subsp. strangulata]|uniref:uncharacterized protein n=1 Tax=Aegilops tauschii subsp. strangulata TaxID=200361 RepID=UPI001E1CA20B|nr:uncharacterized protein LOC123497072 [Aegilops tauschii subsp. strangulata]